MIIYLAGAVHADPGYRAKFSAAQAEATLRYPTATVLNPVDTADAFPAITEPQLMLLLFGQIAHATHIIRIADGLPSGGADLELAWAAYIGIPRLPDLDLP